MSSDCPCCGALDFEPLLDFGHVPVSGRFRARADEPAANAQLAFELCVACGLVRQKRGTPRDYSDTDRATVRQFPSYGTGLIAHVQSLGVGAQDLVLDIGSNDGSFLEALRSAGFARLAGVEPSRRLAEQGRSRGFAVENDYFGPQIAARLTAGHGRARAAVCRHTLEHVPDPLAFVAALRDCLDPQNGVALLEVPDGAAIPELLNIYEFWDEHLYCFCAENLARLVERAGMKVLQIEVHPHLDTRNLTVWCGVASAKQYGARASASRDCAALWRGLVTAWKACRSRVADAVASAPRPLYLIGGSHSQYNFANYAGIGARVDHFIDDDPAKLGRFPPVLGGSPSIISTAQFEARARAGTVLMTGFGYEKWSARICGHARKHGLRIVDPRKLLRP